MMISTTDVAKLFGVANKTVQNYHTSGKLPGVTVKHGMRNQFAFDLNDVIRFADEHGIEYNQKLVFEFAAR